ncbi:DUF6318 family protein [Sinomonas terricola]|uniref:DUF6318 family protein n=1 Tax=Sinomonas terricola TaxID=3110330 RepID=UPI003D176C93
MALRRFAFFSALLFFGVLALGGCAGSPGTDAEPTGPASSDSAPASPSTDSQPTPANWEGPGRNVPTPSLAEAAKQNSAEGFREFTQYWFDTVTYSRETGDTAPLQEASQPTCKMCQAQIEKAQKIHASGGWSIGPRRTVKDFKTNMALDSDGNVLANFWFEESSSISFSEGGAAAVRHTGGPSDGVQVIRGKFTGDHWTTTETGRA